MAKSVVMKRVGNSTVHISHCVVFESELYTEILEHVNPLVCIVVALLLFQSEINLKLMS